VVTKPGNWISKQAIWFFTTFLLAFLSQTQTLYTIVQTQSEFVTIFSFHYAENGRTVDRSLLINAFMKSNNAWWRK